MNWFSNIKNILYLSGAILIVSSLIWLNWLWNSRAYYKELTATQQSTITNMETDMIKKQQALIKLEEIQSQTKKQMDKYRKLVEASKDDKEFNEWRNDKLPSIVVNSLRDEDNNAKPK